MRTYIFLILSVFYLNPLYSNTIELEVSPLSYQGVRQLSNRQATNQGFCVVSEVGQSFTTRDLLLEVFDHDSNRLFEVKKLLSASTQLNELAFDGETLFVSLMVTSFKPKEVYLSYDKQGNLIAEKTIEKISMTVSGNKEYYPKWYVGENGDTYLLRHLKQKKIGYQIEKMNPDLSSSWTQSVFPKKGLLKVASLAANADTVFVHQEKYSWSNNVANTLVYLSNIDGHVVREIALNDESFAYYPTIIRSTDGECVMAGIYFEGKKIGWKEPIGFFVQKHDLSGHVVNRIRTSWKDLKGVLKTETPGYWFKVNPDVMFHEMLVGSDHLYLIGELYKANEEVYDNGISNDDENPSSVSVRLMDFVSVELSSELEILGIDRIVRPHMMVLIEPGDEGSDEILKGGNVLSFVDSMKRNRVFSYQFSSLSSDQKVGVGFTNYEDYRNWVYHLDVDQNVLLTKQLNQFKPDLISKLERLSDLFDSDVPLFSGMKETGMIRYDRNLEKIRGMISTVQGDPIIYEYSALDGLLILAQ